MEQKKYPSNVSILGILKGLARYESKNSLDNLGISGLILKIEEIKDPELKKSLEASGINIGDVVRMDIRVLVDSRHRANEINERSKFISDKLEMRGRTKESNLFDNLLANYDFKLQKLPKDLSNDNLYENKEVYVNSSIAKKIICSVKTEADKSFERVRDYDSEMCL